MNTPVIIALAAAGVSALVAIAALLILRGAAGTLRALTEKSNLNTESLARLTENTTRLQAVAEECQLLGLSVSMNRRFQPIALAFGGRFGIL